MENTQSLKMPVIKALKKNELVRVNGGNPFLIGIGIAAFVEILSDWDNFKNGLAGRKESTR
jgi:spore coat polysaccharide biosynthesis protein SpsF (cytidylyltransferase family)